MNKTYLKISVTVVAAVLVVVHQWVKFDTIALGLLFIAIVPWLSSFLQSAELPGGWKFQFDQVKEEQQKQMEEIERLKFLIEGFVSEPELRHLKKLDSAEPFLVKVDNTSEYFESELRRLRSLGLVASSPGKGIRSLLINDGHTRDVKEHFYITDKGREYLRFRDDTTAAEPH
jgi:hypothetical protein